MVVLHQGLDAFLQFQRLAMVFQAQISPHIHGLDRALAAYVGKFSNDISNLPGLLVPGTRNRRELQEVHMATNINTQRGSSSIVWLRFLIVYPSVNGDRP